MEAARIRKKSLQGNALEIYREEIDCLTQSNAILQRKVLAYDKKEAEWSRTVRSATEDAGTLLEAVSILAASISSTNREGREVRAEARKLLESRGIPPPSTLGSSRERPKGISRKKSA